MGNYFQDPKHFRIMSNAIVPVLSVLNTGRTGGICSASVHASSKGYSIKLAGRTIAKGSTPEELHENYNAAREAAKQGTRRAT